MKNNNVKKISLICVLILLILICLPACEIIKNILPIKETEKFQPYEKTYSLKEAQLLETADFRSLNSVNYSSMTNYLPISEGYLSAVNAFSETIYRAILADGVSDGFSFSPLGLYEILCIAALGSDDETALAALDGLLGMTKETRKNDFINAYKKNFFTNTQGTLQMYNAAFLTSDFTPNSSYVQELTDHYVEAFSMNFRSDESINKLLSWIDEKTGERNFLKKEDLALRNDVIAYLFSTIYFDNKWSSAFVLTNTCEDTFYGKTNKTVAFMKHSYYGTLLDYGDYVECYDYYANGLRIKYLVPKNLTDSIYELTKGKDILSCVPESPERENRYVINLSVPKFSSEYALDLTQTLSKTGLSCLFDKNRQSFNYMFSDLPAPFSTYLTSIKQKNKVTFNEDGTIIKSTTFAQIGGFKSAAPATYDVKLDQPFIYVVYDKNDLPLYVGHVDMP